MDTLSITCQKQAPQRECARLVDNLLGDTAEKRPAEKIGGKHDYCENGKVKPKQLSSMVDGARFFAVIEPAENVADICC
jgi:hypothetical protein